MQKTLKSKTTDTGVTPEMLEKINRYTQTPLTEDEVFVFSVVLCDNEVDRDFERFSVDALKKLAPLFEGKTAIKNHSMDSDDQSARTFQTEVVTDPEKVTSLGEPYTYLKAYCYMPRLQKNEELIAEIGAGIKKEVSVGCAVASCICSVCGADARKTPCKHRRGKSYNGKLCHFVLENPTDAYEWSFVAVPAQKNAGVTKGFEDFGTLKTRLFSEEQEQVVLSKKEAQTISDYLESVREDAENGRAYHAQLCETAVKGFAKVMPALDNRVAETLCRGLSVADLKALNKALSAENEKTAVSLRPYLAADETKTPQNEQFKF